jgi:hypothetical protein
VELGDREKRKKYGRAKVISHTIDVKVEDVRMCIERY